MLEQLSRDHSLVNELVDKGFYTEEEARQSTRKNVITRALGTSDKVKVDIGEDEPRQNDRYLFCSDGLSDLCSDEEMLSIIGEHPDPVACCQALVNAANANGGKDNISVVIMDIQLPDPAPGKIRKTLGWLLKH